MKSIRRIINAGRRKYGKKNGVIGSWFFDFKVMQVGIKDRLERLARKEKQNAKQSRHLCHYEYD